MVSKIHRQRVTHVARLFKLLASPTRALILAALIRHKTCSVGALSEEIGMTHSAVSHQLALMQKSKLVDGLKDGRNTHYSVARTPEAKALARFLTALLAR